MATCLTIAMRKGGVGKTAAVANLAALAAMDGKKVLIVDADSQGNCTDVMTGCNIFSDAFKNKGLCDMLRLQDAVPAKSFIAQTNVKNVDIIPANGMSARVSAQIGILAENGGMSKNLYLAAALSEVADAYDYIFIDTAPGDELVLHNALAAADYVIIPCKLDDYWESSLNWTMGICKIIGDEEASPIDVLGIFYSMAEKVAQAKFVRECVAESAYAPLVFKSEIRKGQAINDMTTLKKPAVISAKQSNAAKDYAALYKEIKKRIKKREKEAE